MSKIPNIPTETKERKKIKMKEALAHKFQLVNSSRNPNSYTIGTTRSNKSYNSKCKTPNESKIIKKRMPKGNFKQILLKAEKRMFKNLIGYNASLNEIFNRISTDIIFDENKHIVCKFKDYLLWDECSEFFHDHPPFKSSNYTCSNI